MKTNWKEMIKNEMNKNGDSFENVVSNTMTKQEMNEEFDNEYGGTEGNPFTLWTKEFVYFPICYDGAEWVGSVSRNPNGRPTEHKGGG
jgi:hypothetical protein